MFVDRAETGKRRPIPPVAELIMDLPALSLTEAGASRGVNEMYHFEDFCHPK
jgi:hypothetical protein